MKNLFLFIVFSALGAAAAHAQDLSNVLGVCHVDGKYYLTNEDFLDEGADQVLATGSKVLKIYLAPSKYPWNSDWPKDIKDLRQMAQTPYFKSVFSKPFTTYIITAYSIGLGDNYWTTSISEEQKAAETKQFHDLTEYLLNTYKGTGKTFVLQQWEGDWAMRAGHEPAYDANYQPPQQAIDGMIQWINARQAGIVAARNEVKDTDVHVYGALEANLVEASMAGKPGVINSVLPHTTVDLASYSCYISLASPERLEKAVDYIAANLPATAAFGQNPHSIYLGEFGYPENGEGGAATVNARLNTAFAVVKSRGVKWALYWEVYCNELKKPPTTAPVNGNDAAVMGYWMVKPDGKPGTAWHRYRRAIITSDPTRANAAAVKASLTNLFTEKFDRPDGTDLGTVWKKSSHYGTVNQSLHDHHLQMEIPDATHTPWGSANLNLKDPAVLGRALNVGEYFEVTIDRKDDHGRGGVELFGSDQLRQATGMAGSSPLQVWSGKTWAPISIDDQGKPISFDWSKPHTFGVRFDSANGYFATFSYYIDGNYAASWLVKTGNKTMNTFGLFTQSETNGSNVEFGDLAIFWPTVVSRLERSMRVPALAALFAWICALNTAVAQPGQYNLDGSAPYLVAHYIIMWYSTPWGKDNPSSLDRSGPSWSHWAWKGGKADHKPDDRLPDGHRDIASVVYPLIGPYDSGSRAVIRYHLATMKAAGVSALCSLWYGPGSNTDRYFPMLLEEAQKQQMRVFICNEEKLNFPGYRHPKNRDDIVKNTTDDLTYIVTKYGQNPSYLRRNGIPVIQQFNAFGKDPLLGKHSLTPDEWRTVFSHVPGKIEYIRQNLEEEYHPPIAAAYVWWDQGKWPRMFAEHAAALRDQGRLDFFMSMVCPGFNDTGVWGWGEGPRLSHGYGLDVLNATMQQALLHNPELVQLVTWNDFNESTCFEPTVQNGTKFLQALGKWWHNSTGKSVQFDELQTALDNYKRECSVQERAEIQRSQ